MISRVRARCTSAGIAAAAIAEDLIDEYRRFVIRSSSAAASRTSRPHPTLGLRLIEFRLELPRWSASRPTHALNSPQRKRVVIRLKSGVDRRLHRRHAASCRAITLDTAVAQ